MGIARRKEPGRAGGRERTRAQHEELMAQEGYRLVRDTPLARVLPWRILEFQHG